MNRHCWFFFAVIAAFYFGNPTANTALAEDYYHGKNIRFIVGYAPGGGYDTYTRAIVRHIGKYIPGNPSLVVQNMDGAGSLIAANYVNNKAHPDGLTVGVWNSAIVLNGALGDASVHFNPKRTEWIGAPAVGLPTCSMMGFTRIRSLKDLINTKKKIKMGATRGGTLNDLPKILNKTLGTRLEVISGYRGTGPIRTAMQKREIDGACWGWESQRVTARAMLDANGDDKLIPILTHGNLEDPELKGLPRLTEVVKGKRNLEIVNSWLQHYNFQRPLSLPPDTPREQINTLRKAFDATDRKSVV